MATSCHFWNGIWYPFWGLFLVPVFFEPLDLLFVCFCFLGHVFLVLAIGNISQNPLSFCCMLLLFFCILNLDFLLLNRLFSETFPSSASANMPVTPGPGADNVAAGCCIVDCPHGAACCARHPNHFISKDEEASRERILASF